jgi:hypothetical protein
MPCRKSIVLLFGIGVVAISGIACVTHRKDGDRVQTNGSGVPSAPETEAQVLADLAADTPAEVEAALNSLHSLNPWPQRISREKVCARIAVILKSSDKGVLRAAIMAASPWSPVDFIGSREAGLHELTAASERYNAMQGPRGESFTVYRHANGQLMLRHALAQVGDVKRGREIAIPGEPAQR